MHGLGVNTYSLAIQLRDSTGSTLPMIQIPGLKRTVIRNLSRFPALENVIAKFQDASGFEVKHYLLIYSTIKCTKSEYSLSPIYTSSSICTF